MWLLIQIFGLFLAVLTTFQKFIKFHRKLEYREEILRSKDYDTYQAIKYGAGRKSSTSMSGSNLILIDLDLIKAINQTDFSHFPDRHPPNCHPDPTMNKMLSFATGHEWKNLKSILTQAFSTSRVRRVYPALNETAFKLVDFIKLQLNETCEIDIVGPVNKYLLELIASSVFGLTDTGIFSSDDSPFEIYTKEVQKAMIRHRQARQVPGLLWLASLFKLLHPNPEALHFFKTTIESSIQRRKENGEKGDDLLQVLMESSDNGQKLTDEMILSQAFMFFFAGTEGPATLLIYSLYELAMNQNFQDKLYEEIVAYEELDYETITNLPYLDMFVCEVLRMYSSGVTARRCTKKYIHPKVVIKQGTNVHTPIYGIHHDEEFYPSPFTFNPDNFTDNAKANRPPLSYMPFGIGPRSCIAAKFGLVQGKSAICSIIYNFKVEVCWRTETPPKGNIASMYLPSSLFLKFVQRK